MMIHALGLAAMIAGAPEPVPVPERAADPLVARLARLAAELELTTHAADPLDLCTDAGPGLDAVPLASLLAAALAELGLPGVPPCPASADERDDAARDRAARDAGAEWRLVVRPEDEGLAMELHAVDRGLWGPRDLGPIVAWAKEPPVETAPTASVEPSPRPEPGVSVTRAIVSERPVRALAACDLNGDGSREVIGVTDDRVVVWRDIRGVLALQAEWIFADLPRARIKVRSPVAGCVCGAFGPGGATRLAIGHSDLERGVVLLARTEGTGMRLERERSLGAIPLAVSAGAILAALPDQGRNRLGPQLLISRADLPDRAVELPRPILEIAALPGLVRAYVLDAEYRLHALGEGPSLGASMGASGAGIALVRGPDQALFLATTSRTPGPNDSVRIVDVDTGATRAGPIAVAGAVVASASARPGELWIATRGSEGPRTVILRLTIGEVPR